MASLFTTHPLPTRLFLFSASSSSPVALKLVVLPPACHAGKLFDVLPQSDGGSDLVADGNPQRTKAGGAGSVSVSRKTVQGAVSREANLSAQQGRNRGARRWIREGDRLVLGEGTEGEAVDKDWRGSQASTAESEGRRRSRRWTRGGMQVQEPVKTRNLATCGEDRGGRKVSKRGKRSKGGERAGKLRVELDMCSKRGDVMGAIDLYDSAVKEGVRMGQHHYNVLLYLCSSAALGIVQPAKSGTNGRLDSSSAESSGYSEDNDMREDCVHDQERNKFNLFRLEETASSIPVSDEIKEYARTRGFEIFDKMCSEKDRVPMSEAALTAVARMAMSMGNGDMAFETVKQMKELGIAPKLRSYGPALTAFCSSSNVDKAFEVEAYMLESRVTPEEPELGMLLSASVVARQGDRVYYLLHKFRTTVRQVSPSTAELLEAWFSSSTASKVGKRKWDICALSKAIENNGGGWHGLGWLGRGKWIMTRSHIDKNGVCLACGDKLAIIDLDPKETEDFATMVAKLALKREKNSNFGNFQVNAVVNATQKRFPSRKWPLIVVHNRHLTGKHMKNPANQKLVEKWKQANALYETPTGSNDDCSGTGCLLLSDGNA